LLAAACILFLAAAAYFVLVELHRAAAVVNFDVYLYFIPNKLHAVQSVWHGGKGLLWNPYQACGEPFLANPAMGLFYPLHLLFLVLDPNVAVHAVLIINMALGATGMLLLGRELGFSWVAALGGALTFELGDAMSTLTGWSPMDNGPWTWLPWALLCCERLLRAPSRRGVAALAAVLALSLLAGWVLISALTYQLIALRLGWELVTRWSERPWRPMGAVVAGLVLGACLAAMQLVPAAELVSESERISVTQRDFLAYGGLTTDWRAAIRDRVPPVPFMVAPLILAAVAPLVGSRRRLVVFYLATGALYATLALGPRTPLYDLYIKLPPGAVTLRYPHRLFMIAGFTLPVLVASTLDGIRSASAGMRTLGAAVALVLSAALYWLTPGGLRPVEVVSLACLVGALWAAAARPRLLAPAWIVVGAVVLSLVGVPFHYLGRLLPSADVLWRHADTFATLRSSMTPQDRINIEQSMKSILDLSLVQKTAGLMRVPDVYDYEALLGGRLVDYVTTMWQGGPVNSVEAMTVWPTVQGGYRPRLFDLAAVRYVVTPPSSRFAAAGLELPPAPMSGPDLLVYANDSALPRARWVPRVEVIPDANALLNRLAYDSDDLAALAFVEEPPLSGFAGETAPSAQAGTARFVLDDPEHLVIDVDAPARGFLVLADQYSPGWRARVDGSAVPIVRANYTFRLVEVPAGRSRVEFRYRPASVAIGAAVSHATVALLGAALRRKRHG
jgi:hypothetical protein